MFNHHRKEGVWSFSALHPMFRAWNSIAQAYMHSRRGGIGRSLVWMSLALVLTMCAPSNEADVTEKLEQGLTLLPTVTDYDITDRYREVGPDRDHPRCYFGRDFIAMRATMRSSDLALRHYIDILETRGWAVYDDTFEESQFLSHHDHEGYSIQVTTIPPGYPLGFGRTQTAEVAARDATLFLRVDYFPACVWE